MERGRADRGRPGRAGVGRDPDGVRQIPRARQCPAVIPLGAGLLLPVVQRNLAVCRITWRAPAYHTVVQVLHNPLYAGAYAFARRGNRIRVENGRARKTSGHDRPMAQWGALIRDNHEGYITWAEFEENQRLFGENAHMQKRASRKAARGGRALLTGLVRCGCCGRMMRVFYGSGSGHAHRYQCRGDDAHVGAGLCIGIGGVRVDQAVTALMLEAVSGHAVEAAMLAAKKLATEDDALTAALGRDLEAARYDASLAARRYDLVDPARRHVARELEARWNTALEQVAVLERRIATARTSATARPEVDRDALMRLAADLPAAWNAPTADNRARQRLTHILVREVVIDLDDVTHEAVVIVHWAGGQHTEVRVPRVRCKPRCAEPARSPAEVVRRLAQEWPDREIAVTLNRMRCRTSVGENWTSVTVREVRERLGVPPFRPPEGAPTSIGMQEVARRFGICIPSVLRLIREGTLPAAQAMPYAPWKIPLEALATEPVLVGLRRVKERRPKNLQGYHRDETMRLPGL
nr:recombinase family protein [Pseudoroseomonas vastitatis]